VLEKVAMGHGFLTVLLFFPPSVSFQQRSTVIFIDMLLVPCYVPERMGEAWEIFKKQRSSGNQGAKNRKV